jgi:hypothetical protein
MIQEPCGFDIIDVYENGIIRMYHEIDEQDFVWISRMNGKGSWKSRYGKEDHRNIVVQF